MNSTNDFEERFKRLKLQYTEQIPEKISAIIEDWQNTKETGDQETLKRLHRNVHSLVGTSGTFGFSNLSLQARELEIELKTFTEIPKEKPYFLEKTHTVEEKINALIYLIQTINLKS
jgi:HPt (histidine-containing phosphotransfer) domain-containing protein